MPSIGTPNGTIAGWWADLNPGGGGAVDYETLGIAPNRRAIVQFKNVPHCCDVLPVTFQFKLFEGTNIIEVHYLTSPSDGGTHSAGVENETGTLGVSFHFGTKAIPDSTAVRCTPGGPKDSRFWTAPKLAAPPSNSRTFRAAD